MDGPRRSGCDVQDVSVGWWSLEVFEAEGWVKAKKGRMPGCCVGIARLVLWIGWFLMHRAVAEPVVLLQSGDLLARPSLDGPVLARLAEGEIVEASSARVGGGAAGQDWLAVVAPPRAKVWISVGAVELGKGTVRGEPAFLRAGPGVLFPSVGQVPKGTLLDTSERLGLWIRIAAPPACVLGYVQGHLVEKAGMRPRAVQADPPVAAVAPSWVPWDLSGGPFEETPTPLYHGEAVSPAAPPMPLMSAVRLGNWEPRQGRLPASMVHGAVETKDAAMSLVARSAGLPPGSRAPAEGRTEAKEEDFRGIYAEAGLATAWQGQAYGELGLDLGSALPGTAPALPVASAPRDVPAYPRVVAEVREPLARAASGPLAESQGQRAKEAGGRPRPTSEKASPPMGGMAGGGSLRSTTPSASSAAPTVGQRSAGNTNIVASKQPSGGRRIRYQGVVVRVPYARSAGRFQLANLGSGKASLGFLVAQSKEIDLAAWLGRKVVLEGDEHVDERVDPPVVIRVHRIAETR